MDKKNLLTIGEMSKFTGASIHSLRYYERIKVLAPAYVDQETGYRYYQFDQIYLVDFIGLCIEMDIPLKDFPKFTGAGDIVDVRAFLAEGKNIAIKKLSAIKRGLRFIKKMEQQMDIAEAYQPGQIYTRHIPEKLFYVYKCQGQPKDLNLEDISRKFISMMPFSDENDMPEYGFLYSSAGDEYYAFGEISDSHLSGEDKCIMRVPAGEYFCTLCQDSQIENAREIFREHLPEESSFIAIETEIVVAKYRIYQPMHEIRALALL